MQGGRDAFNKGLVVGLGLGAAACRLPYGCCGVVSFSLSLSLSLSLVLSVFFLSLSLFLSFCLFTAAAEREGDIKGFKGFCLESGSS